MPKRTYDTSMDHLRYGLVWPKKVFVNFFYLIRVEHKKCSEMRVLIVRFGQKLRNWDCFVKKVNIVKSVYMSLTPFILNPGYQRGPVQKF
jgi:hypothetical protein